MKNSNCGIAPIATILIIAGILVLAGGGWWYMSQKSKVEAPVQNQQQLAADETANWKTYKNEQYGFEFDYPNNYSIDPSSDVNQSSGLNLKDDSGHFDFRVRVNDKNISNYQWVGINAICTFNKDQKAFQGCDYLADKGKVSGITKDGSSYYFLSDGDVGAFIYNYLIPDYLHNRWITFKISGDWNGIDVQKLRNQWDSFKNNFDKALKSFRFSN